MNEIINNTITSPAYTEFMNNGETAGVIICLILAFVFFMIVVD